MADRQRQGRTRQSSNAPRTMPTVHPHAAGLDVGSTFHVVAVPAESSGTPVRTFRSFTGDL
jgi:transposase